MEEAIQVQIEQRRRLKKYMKKIPKEKKCMLCDKKTTKISSVWDFNCCGSIDNTYYIDKNKYCVCEKCEPKCFYCGQSNLDMILQSLSPDREVETRIYGDIVLFCGDCAPSCKAGDCYGYADEDCVYCDSDYSPSRVVNPHIKRIAQFNDPKFE